MEVNNSITYNEELNKYKKEILAGIEHLLQYCQNHKYFDEYTYILLWRPIEWIIDYTILDQYIKMIPNLSKKEIEEFICERNKLTVDQRVSPIKSDGNSEFAATWLKNHINQIDHLRWCRNAVVYHYIEDSEVDPFACFDSICENFIRENSPDTEYIPLSSLNLRIQLSEMSGIYDINIDQIYARIKKIINYYDDATHDRVILICKMEEFAQLLAYKILKDDLNKNIQYELNEKKGIYIDEKKVTSYIDALTDEVAEKDWLILKKTCQSLKKIREIRNLAMHVLNIPDETEEAFRSVWATTIINSFGYDERICYLLEPKISKENFQRHLRDLSSCINYYKNESSRQAIVSIGNIITLILSASHDASDIYFKYMGQLENVSSKKREKLYNKLSKKMLQTFNKILAEADETTKSKYKDLAIQYFGAKYDNNEDTYYCLETALLLHDTIGDLSCDYAGICIELTKALEIYLYNKISCKLKGYLDKHPDMKKKISKDIRGYLDNGTITLGNYPYLYQDDTSDDSRIFFEFCKSQKIYSYNNDNILKDELLFEMKRIGEISNKYRNNIAHRGIITEQIMSACMKEILKGDDSLDKAFLKRVSEAMGDI